MNHEHHGELLKGKRKIKLLYHRSVGADDRAAIYWRVDEQLDPLRGITTIGQSIIYVPQITMLDALRTEDGWWNLQILFNSGRQFDFDQVDVNTKDWLLHACSPKGAS